MLYGLLCLPCIGQKLPNIDSLMVHYRYMADRYMVKNKYLYQYFEIDGYGIRMFSSSRNKRGEKAEFSLPWEELEDYKRLIRFADRALQYEVYCTKKEQTFSFSLLQSLHILEQNHQLVHPKTDNPFYGLKIAIDPGHIAGNLPMAMIEQRFVEMKHPETGKKVHVIEGVLTLQTAQILKDSLENLGAIVMLTREKHDRSAEGISFQYWKKHRHPRKMKQKGFSPQQIADSIKNTAPAILFDEFANEDLDLRAEKINYFKPDFTFVLHYNVDVNNTLWRNPTQKNYALTFVPGAYISGELSSKLERFDFLRRLLTEQVADSDLLSQEVLKQFNERLKVPPLTDQQAPAYVRRWCLKVGEGVYARNLRLCRLLNSPICYGEPLLQDNASELAMLTKINPEHGVPDRIVEVAQAYLEGLRAFLLKKQKSK